MEFLKLHLVLRDVQLLDRIIPNFDLVCSNEDAVIRIATKVPFTLDTVIL